MELSHSLEATIFSVPSEICSMLWNSCSHKNPLLVSILSQIDPVHTTHPISPRSILILATYLCFGLPSGTFPSGFPANSLHVTLPSPLRSTRPANLNPIVWTLGHICKLLDESLKIRVGLFLPQMEVYRNNLETLAVHLTVVGCSSTTDNFLSYRLLEFQLF
jgi:hypothetical protein